MNSVTVRIPATTANLGPGFDCLGMALDIHNIITLAEADRTTVEVTGLGVDRISRSERNLILRSANRLAEFAGKHARGWALEQHNVIPLARGMGSSSSAIVGGLVAANAVLGTNLPEQKILELAVEIEAHPDNVAPALLGGLTVCCTDEDGLGVARFDAPKGLHAVLAVPSYELSTEAARRVMPKEISHADGVFNTCHSTAVLAAMLSQDWELLGQAMKDRLHEPYREKLVTGMAQCVTAAREAGACASALSGSGPTIIAFVSDADSNAVQEAMLNALITVGVSAQGFITDLSNAGAVITT